MNRDRNALAITLLICGICIALCIAAAIASDWIYTAGAGVALNIAFFIALRNRLI